MNALHNLVEFYNHLPLDSTYRVVVKGILENLDKMGDVTIYDVVELTNSSRTTIWRMVQKMGYSSFSEFRYALQSAVKQYIYYNRVLPLEKTLTTSAIVGAFADQLRDTAAVLEEYFTPERCEEIVTLMHQAHKVCFYLPFRFQSVITMQQNLAMDGKQTSCQCLLPDMLEDAQTLDETALVFFSPVEVSAAMDMEPVFRLVHERGAGILLTADETSRFLKYADYILFVDRPMPENIRLCALEFGLFTLGEVYRKKYIEKR